MTAVQLICLLALIVIGVGLAVLIGWGLRRIGFYARQELWESLRLVGCILGAMALIGLIVFLIVGASGGWS